MRDLKRLKLEPHQPLTESNPLLERAEIKLILAIIEQAVIDLLAPSKDKESFMARRSARYYLLDSPLTDARPLSFAWACFQLNINPKRFRKLLRSALIDPTAATAYKLAGRLHNLRGTGNHTKKH